MGFKDGLEMEGNAVVTWNPVKLAGVSDGLVSAWKILVDLGFF
jgi:hypothetical protein